MNIRDFLGALTIGALLSTSPAAATTLLAEGTVNGSAVHLDLLDTGSIDGPLTYFMTLTSDGPISGVLGFHVDITTYVEDHRTHALLFDFTVDHPRFLTLSSDLRTIPLQFRIDSDTDNSDGVQRTYTRSHFSGFDFDFVSTEPVSFSLSLTGVGLVPEPAAWSLMILGMGAAGSALRRRRALVQAA